MEDTLFSLTQYVELAEKEGRPLWSAFLNIKGTYDNVILDKLCNIMRRLDADNRIMTFVKDIYRQQGTNSMGRKENKASKNKTGS